MNGTIPMWRLFFLVGFPLYVCVNVGYLALLVNLAREPNHGTWARMLVSGTGGLIVLGIFLRVIDVLSPSKKTGLVVWTAWSIALTLIIAWPVAAFTYSLTGKDHEAMVIAVLSFG